MLFAKRLRFVAKCWFSTASVHLHSTRRTQELLHSYTGNFRTFHCAVLTLVHRTTINLGLLTQHLTGWGSPTPHYEEKGIAFHEWLQIQDPHLYCDGMCKLMARWDKRTNVLEDCVVKLYFSRDSELFFLPL